MEVRQFKKRLKAEEAYLLSEIEAQEAELQDATEAAGEERISAPEDAGSEIFEHEKILAVEGAFESMLAEVRHALHKIDAGSYGICDNCGAAIDIERLRARPQAAMCVPCKARDEHFHGDHHRTLAAGAV
jgi:RNA polymerase-binding protein DksA